MNASIPHALLNSEQATNHVYKAHYVIGIHRKLCNKPVISYLNSSQKLLLPFTSDPFSAPGYFAHQFFFLPSSTQVPTAPKTPRIDHFPGSHPNCTPQQHHHHHQQQQQTKNNPTTNNNKDNNCIKLWIHFATASSLIIMISQRPCSKVPLLFGFGRIQARMNHQRSSGNYPSDLPVLYRHNRYWIWGPTYRHLRSRRSYRPWFTFISWQRSQMPHFT
jgi:hypothetical protein